MQARESSLQVGCGPKITLWNRTHKRLVSEPDEDAIADAEEINYRELLSWLKVHGEHDACSKVTLGSLNGRRGLIAMRDIEAGECILRVSNEIIMTPDKLSREFMQPLPDDVGEWTRLALLLLAEKRAGRASTWAPYISCLPKWGSIHSTAFWRKEELAMIKESSLYHETMHRRATIRAEFAAVQKSVLGDSLSYASFKHAYITVCSRAWSIAGLNKLALVPFADFLNHDYNSSAVLTYDNDKGYAELFADRSYAAGEQVVISYGQISNASLALDFGFTLPYNPNDKVEVWIGVSRRDKLRKEKLQRLHSCGIYTLLNPDDSDSGGSSFTIREVKSTTGEGNEIPDSLFTMARIICANSSKELSEEKLGCERMEDRIKEAQVMAFLLTRVEALIQRHIEAILAFHVKKPVIIEGRTLSLCLEMAEAILGGELRVLRSTSAWLKHRWAETWV